MSLATPKKIQTLQRKLCLKAKREQDIVHASRMNLVREPGAGNPHARFDERGAETEWMARLSETPTRKGGNGRGSHGLEPSPRRSSTLPMMLVACASNQPNGLLEGKWRAWKHATLRGRAGCRPRVADGLALS